MDYGTAHAELLKTPGRHVASAASSIDADGRTDASTHDWRRIP